MEMKDVMFVLYDQTGDNKDMSLKEKAKMLDFAEELTEYCRIDALATENAFLRRQNEELLTRNNQLEVALTELQRKKLEMENTKGVAYTISLQPRKIRVVCEHCRDRGYVSTNCNKCGGNGSHNKTQLFWVVNKRQTEIVKIDRDKETGKLRYWTNMSEYFLECVTDLEHRFYDAEHNNYPNGVHFVHFSKTEAQAEADRLNRVLIERGVLVCNN